MESEPKDSTDYRDERSGAYDAVNETGRPQPDQVREATTPHQVLQGGADVRSDPLPGPTDVLPERLRRRPRGPVNPRRGRGN
jgi:hypothetical protein